MQPYQDIGQLQADVQVINTELARQTHFRGYFTTNDEILKLANPALDDYAYSAEDLLVWDYDGSQWIETDKIVPDQVTPASDANPQADGTVTAGTSTEYSRGDHIHPLNISTNAPISDTASEDVGTSVNYARSYHSHPLNINTTLPLQDSQRSVGTSNQYARSDHSQQINVETNTSNIPVVDGIGNNGASALYARQHHVHPQQLTYDANVTATKFIKTGGTASEVLCANGDTKAISGIDSDSVQKTGKPLQIIQGLLRYGGEPPQDDDVESEESDDDDYQTKGQIYSYYVNKSQTETITGRKAFKNNQFEIQLTGSSTSFAGVTCGAVQINPNGNNFNEGLRISRSTVSNYSGIYLGCNPSQTSGALTDQWSIVNTPTGEL
ncbi:MAG: hypothetical protein EZS28_023506 [Streblomastix strix]|uniref:Uncharacterized protein n=1 Tax=Streblomastix strix TaxID=222440 RepID=A0A5J4VEX0_9EUKA|nr:MAG: hypothetical protein EZS28_023506 [Streblomastix strix]